MNKIEVHPLVVTKMADAQLLKHFSKIAGYSADAPSQPYNFRFGGKFYCAADTDELFKKFQKAVRAFKPPNLIHLFSWSGGVGSCKHCNTKFADVKRNKPCPARMKKAGYA